MTERVRPSGGMRVGRIGVVIVTHDSERVLAPCVAALERQERAPDQVVLVDSGSASTSSLDDYARRPRFTVTAAGNIGFSRANNLGFTRLEPAIDLVLFLNPDAFLASDFLVGAEAAMARDPAMAALTGKLLGYDLESGRATGRLDSTGIFRAWYGRWRDRGQGEEERGQYDRPERVPAICGALMFCRRTALEQAAGPDGAIFDPAFFLYKEDIELSLRLRRHGFSLWYLPELTALHCRGWAQNRREMDFRLRKIAAHNEIRLYLRHPSPYLLWALLKYLLVAGLRF